MTPPPDADNQITLEFTAATVNIYVKSWLVFSTRLTTSLELGRQRPGEAAPYTRVADRVIIAKLRESNISRQHVLLTLLPDNQVRVENLSSVNTILVGDEEIQPGEHRDLAVPATLTLFDRVIQIEPQEEQPDLLESLSHLTIAPGQDPSTSSSFTEMLSGKRSSADTETLLKGLSAALGVAQRATGSSDFLSLAAKAMIDAVGLETAAALVWTGGGWKIDAVHRRPELNSQPPPEWMPSRTILQRVLLEKRTFLRVPRIDPQTAPSLRDVIALVVAPILNAQEEVVGALYGDRRSAAGTFDVEISRTEAVLVELLASSAAAGLERIKQQHSAREAQSRFEQFFTVELAQQLQQEPELLQGRDAEVTLLLCEVRGFSQVSEKLGPRLTLDWINDVMGTLSDCIANHGGVLVDTLGDELSGMWGAPVSRDDHTACACRAALEMFQQLPALNRRWRDALPTPVDLAIGIHSGMARVGNIGSQRKFKYGPLGSVVARTRMTQQATGPLRVGILLSGSPAEELAGEFPIRRLCRATAANDEQSLELFELAAHAPDDWPELRRRYESALEAGQRGDLPTATSLLAKILIDHPDDQPSLRLLAMLHNHAPEDPWTL